MRNNGNISVEYDDHIYYDLSCTNQDDTGKKKYPLTFQENRSTVFLKNPQDYYCSIMRFTVKTKNIPVLVPKMLLNVPASLNSFCNIPLYLTEYKFYYKVNGVTVNGGGNGNHIRYIPENINISMPSTPNNDYDVLNNEYFYVQSYDWFIYSLNVQIKDILINNGVPVGDIPFLEIDGGNLNVKFKNFGRFANETPIYDYSSCEMLCFNAPLMNLFNSFSHSFIETTAGNEIYRINCDSNQNEVVSRNSPFPAWSPVNSIVFTTSLLPVAQTKVAAPVIVDSSTTNTPKNGASMSIVTDFNVPFSGLNGTYKNEITYAPVSEYRLNDMYSNNPLTNINLSVYWKDIYGNLHSVFLTSGESSEIKLLFRKKDYNKKLN